MLSFLSLEITVLGGEQFLKRGCFEAFVKVFYARVLSTLTGGGGGGGKARLRGLCIKRGFL